MQERSVRLRLPSRSTWLRLFLLPSTQSRLDLVAEFCFLGPPAWRLECRSNSVVYYAILGHRLPSRICGGRSHAIISPTMFDAGLDAEGYMLTDPKQGHSRARATCATAGAYRAGVKEQQRKRLRQQVATVAHGFHL